MPNIYGFHDITQNSMSFNDFMIVTVGKNYFRIHFWCMMKNEAASRMKISNLSEKIDNCDKKMNYYSDGR